MNHKSSGKVAFATAALIAMAAGAAKEMASAATVVPVATVKWVGGPGGPPVSIAPVDGDPNKGPSHFYLKYAACFLSPNHHHSADHFVTTVSGTLVLTVDGKEQRLAPGSFFSLTKKAAHIARCEAGTDCVMFVDARSTWDLVPEAGPATKS